MYCDRYPVGSYNRDSCERYWAGVTSRKGRKRRKATEKIMEYGDVKPGFQANDHSGWIKMDGRATSLLSVAQRDRANAVGFSTNIPDATGSVLVQGGPLGVTSGSNLRTLLHSDLPNVVLNAVTGTAGDHTHTGVTNQGGVHSHKYIASPNASNGVQLDSGGQTRAKANINPSSDTTDAGAHSHNLLIDSGGEHTHSVSINLNNGTQTLIDVSQQSLSLNMFIYLGL